MATKLQRHLDLIAYLVGRRVPVAFDQIRQAVPAYASKFADGGSTAQATVRRLFERDKDDLRRAGIPLRTIRFSSDYEPAEVEGYVITRRDFYLPYLRLVSGDGPPVVRHHSVKSPAGEVELREADSTLALKALRGVARVPSFPLVAEAMSAYRKLSFDLAPDTLPPESVTYVDPPGAEELRARLRVLSEALLARKHATFRYRSMRRDAESDRRVAGYGLLFQQGHWYLIAMDEDKREMRVFRVDRMNGVAMNGARANSPDYEIPPGFRLEDYARREAWELGGEEESPIIALVLFRFPSSLLAERNAQGELVEAREDGGAVRSFRVSQVDPFVRWLLSLEGEAELLSPPALRRAFADAAAQVAAVHAGASHHA
jgi:predicted DNA-binding transcriptional regulator YafY